MITATITYIHHNCFLLDTEDRILVFDYPAREYRPRGMERMVRRHLGGRRAVFFASHGHEDHFSTDVLDLARETWESVFVVSYDIAELVPAFQPEIFPHGPLVVVEPDEESLFEDMSVVGYESTDMGVGFGITLGGGSRHGETGLRVYFGGDVALWNWEGQSEPQTVFNRDHFADTLEQVGRFQPHVAFSNADRRLPDWAGGLDFVRQVRPGLFVPMHAFGRPQDLESFVEQASHTGVPLFRYHHMGESTTVTWPVTPRSRHAEG